MCEENGTSRCDSCAINDMLSCDCGFNCAAIVGECSRYSRIDNKDVIFKLKTEQVMTNRLYTAVMSNEVIHGKTDTVLHEQGLGRCIFERGWGNGYVLVPPCHPCHGKSYDELHDIAVHGGLTFSSAMDNEHVTRMQWVFLDGVPENLEDYWAFGFDTNHYRDNAREHTLLYVVQETNSLKQQLEDYGKKD